ncbi:hypothetical protein SGPA1_40592 [Streptomyces misionensis JCM 4497]
MQHAEGHGVLHVLRGAGRVAADDPAGHEELGRADVQGRGVGADGDQFPAGGQAVHGGRDGLRVPRGGEDDLGAAQGLQRLGDRGGGGAVDVVVGAELTGEVGLLRPPGDRHGLEAHRDGVLHPEVSEAAEAEHRDQVARPAGAAAQPVERGHARAGQRPGVARGQRLGDPGQGVDGRDHLLGEAAVVGPARHLQVVAHDEVALAAGPAVAAAAAEPAHGHPVAGLPAAFTHPLAQLLDPPGDLVPRHVGERHARQPAADEEGVAVADAARLDGDPHMAGPRLRHLALDQLEGAVRCGHLGDSIATHGSLRRKGARNGHGRTGRGTGYGGRPHPSRPVPAPSRAPNGRPGRSRRRR